MTDHPQHDRVPGDPWGTPVDRDYIEQFLTRHARRIRGNVLGVKDAEYTLRLWGLSVRDLNAEGLDVNDPRFPLVACAHAEKPG